VNSLQAGQSGAIFPAGERDSFLLQIVMTGSGTHPFPSSAKTKYECS